VFPQLAPQCFTCDKKEGCAAQGGHRLS